MKTWQIWAEGYAATGESGNAQLLGKQKAATFTEACTEFYNANGGATRFGPYDPPTDGRPPCFWLCRLFDNEQDARRSHG